MRFDLCVSSRGEGKANLNLEFRFRVRLRQIKLIIGLAKMSVQNFKFFFKTNQWRVGYFSMKRTKENKIDIVSYASLQTSKSRLNRSCPEIITINQLAMANRTIVKTAMKDIARLVIIHFVGAILFLSCEKQCTPT